ncbi:hypothetical protein WN59_09040 [Salinicoccus sediminis]|uniref:HTH tetR-type domain-containing protein n=1 Tax=Salinicoccus sediminis TaxID=1432562 RepID=A0A0M2SLK8_9STAP|nr:TetR/AcrR family transcriptional regulator [Salinicoccus sediminis]KKK33752.1 hypothetical protein WN59_09040 [Salinicoccus sediminis]
MGLREANKERRRSGIIRTAEELFVKNGFNAVHMQDIADAEGIGIATLFRYFPKKKQLILAVATSIMESEADAFKNILDQPGRTAYEKLEDCFKYMKDSKNHPGAKKSKFNDAFLVYADNTLEPLDNMLPYINARRRIADHFMELIDMGKEDGSLHSERCCRKIMLPILNNFGIYTQKLAMSDPITDPNGDLSTEHQLETVSRIYLEYLKPE